ncbi:hypothetical protein [Methanobrevibacter sp.]|uniref:hypothetical protein n=1 Tax=Methanobrevibacter sp. TaxID=66852 RepID=UPI0026DF024B|nr:hypothetical protein [Methanobrevibacter sp.]MDO5859166.1 hypothetical protein [Methanobrevibacter sp.]
MIKHGVVMVTSLILALCLLGAVSASDITASDVDTQSINQEDTQIEIAQSSDTSTVEVENSVSQSCEEDIISNSAFEELEEHIESISIDSNVDESENVILIDDSDESSYEYYDSSYSDDDELLDLDVEEIVAINLDNDLVISGLVNDNSASFSGYELGYDVTTAACELLDFESAEDILVITTVDSTEITDVTTENVLNGIVDASNGYVTYEKGNLVTLSSLKSDLINIAFFIKKGESLTMAFYNNGAITSLCSGDVCSQKYVDLWNIVESWIDAFEKGAEFDESLQHFSLEQEFGQDMAQPLLGYNNEIESSNDLLGIQQDSDGDAFIWSIDKTPDKSACFSADSKENESLIGLNMENNTSENGMITVMSYDQSNSKQILKVENNLNPDVHQTGGLGGKTSGTITPEDIKQIGVDAARKAIAYFRSRGIDVIKDYENFYIFTSAGYATIEGLSTQKAINGLLEVFGSRISDNIYLIHTPLWKDLVFYFIWVNGANNKDYISYALKYDSNQKEWIVSSLCKKQGDAIAYELGLFDNNPVHPDPYRPDAHPKAIHLKDLDVGSLANSTNATKKIGKDTNASNASIKDVSDKIVDELPASKVNPYNIVYTLASVFMVCALFGVSYSKP